MKARVTHLRHVGVAVPDFDKLVDFYGGVWGLKRIDGEKDVAYFAAEGSPEHYVYRIRRADQKRLDLISFGAEDPAAVDRLAEDLARAGVRFASEPGPLQTPGGGYGFRFFDPLRRGVYMLYNARQRRPGASERVLRQPDGVSSRARERHAGGVQGDRGFGLLAATRRL